MAADNLQGRGPRDRSRVNVHEAWELRYWSDIFAVEPKQLRAAVIVVGPLVKDVEEFLWKTSERRQLFR